MSPTHTANRSGLTQCKKGLCSLTFHHRLVFMTSFVLERVHGLKLAEGLDGGDVLLLGASSDACLAFLRLFPFDQRFLLRSLHAPGHHGRVDRSRSVHLLVLGGRYVGCLYGQHHCIHQVLGCLDQGGGAIQLKRDKDKEKCQKVCAAKKSAITFLASARTLEHVSYMKHLWGLCYNSQLSRIKPRLSLFDILI